MVEPALEEVLRLGEGAWGLGRARAVARSAEGSKRAVRALINALVSEDVELRKRAADVLRRITEQSAAPLWRYADTIAGVLAEVDPGERRTRWHLGLVVARVARTSEQRLRAARLMELLAEDEGNVVRCSGIEGIAILACAEASLRDRAEEMIEQALRSGTKAERCRAREGEKILRKATALDEGRRRAAV